MIPFKPVIASMFSSTYVLLFILLGLLAIYLIPNYTTVLSAMGFETKSSLRASLATVKSELDDAVNLNHQNNKELSLERITNEKIQAEIATLTKKQVKAQAVVTSFKEKKTQKDAPAVQRLKDKTVTTADTVTLPIAELNTLSASNIEQVHDVFDTLFPPT